MSCHNSPRASGDVVVPQLFHQTLQQNFPAFAQRAREGHLMQQDAEECWTNIVSTLARKLRGPAAATSSEGASAGADGAVMRRMFGIDFTTRLKCHETGEERVVNETQYVFKCNIDGAVNHLHDGFKISCDMTRTQRSELASPPRDVDFTGVSRISRLPMLLTVQMVRFFWKGGEANTRAKILRAVTFPVILVRTRRTPPRQEGGLVGASVLVLSFVPLLCVIAIGTSAMLGFIRQSGP